MIDLSRSRHGGASLAGRLSLAAILAVAAWAKIKDPSEVVATLQGSGLLPSAWSQAGAYLVIGAEVVLALSLLPKKTAPLGLAGYAAFASLLFGFSLWRWWQDIKAPCSCFGLLLRLLPWQGALLSSLMCAAALLTLKSLSHTLPRRYETQKPVPLGDPA